MKKKLIYLLGCLVFFNIGILWNKLFIETSSKSNNASVENVDYENHRNYALYKLNYKILEDNHLKGQIEGYYNVFVQTSNGEKSKLFDNSREIVKNGQDYFLKAKYNTSHNPTTKKDEYIQLKLLEEMNMKLVLLKSDEK